MAYTVSLSLLSQSHSITYSTNNHRFSHTHTHARIFAAIDEWKTERITSSHLEYGTYSVRISMINFHLTENMDKCARARQCAYNFECVCVSQSFDVIISGLFQHNLEDLILSR